MSAWFHSLRGRITLVTVSVAVLAVLITGLVSAQLVRQSTITEGRAQLAAQAQLLSRLPAATNLASLRERVRLALGDTRVAVVGPQGRVSGPGAAFVSAADVTTLLAGDPVSQTEGRTGKTMLVEGRPTASGSAIVLVRSLGNLETATAATVRRVFLALAIGVLVAIVAGTLLARWLTRPLVATVETARRMAAGERGLVMEAHQPTEVAAVAEALATLDRALSTSEGRQREFLLSISHELRTPLTAVRGYGEAMVDGLIREGDIASVGATLVTETERLDRFVADLLELARLEADDFAVVRQRVDVALILEQTADAWRGRAATLDVTVKAIPGSPGLAMETDAQRVRQLIDGLVENALRVSPAGSTVSIAARAFGTGVVIEVRDGGPGLSSEDLAVAFERGALQARYRDIRAVGTGLGLSIAARLVSRLGGSIAAGNAPGGGAVFAVSLPAA
ncbi:HAMP domain-containing histidine kinase [Glaciihabitans sp. INWT7]|uniref:sensor histidine kinase n=1 Tax=Glaciihabitans sp. INWT7 TaxID=2596912 RepID=UPI001628A8DE|nr:HAMP domain-containing sensor histidine kinase [Glaciihabitans sp. INWT7]QNE47410.1 HAMP domain-containing histidine kinase [Glaciihabitans sp. INWT7]